MKKLAMTAAALLFAAPAMAQQEKRTEVGVLDCVVEGGAGFVIGSQKDLSCTFTAAETARPKEVYTGKVSKFGLDVGITGVTLMQWLVLAPTTDPFGPGALDGNYVGASAEITAAIGGGANILIGGSNQTIVLQPVSVQAQTGLNLAVGVSEFTLNAAVD